MLHSKGQVSTCVDMTKTIIRCPCRNVSYWKREQPQQIPRWHQGCVESEAPMESTHQPQDQYLVMECVPSSSTRADYDHIYLLCYCRLTVPQWRCCTFSDMLRVKAILEEVGYSPLTADHNVVSRLIPEIITKWSGCAFLLPSASYFKCVTIQ